MAAGDLAQLDDVKAWLAIPPGNTDDDALLARLITAVSDAIVQYVGQGVASATYTVTGAGGAALILTNGPVIAVTSVSVNGMPVTTYTLDGNRVKLNDVCYGNSAPISVTYTAGYATIPPGIQQAAIEITALRYSERGRIGQVSKTLAGEVVTFTQTDIPVSARSYLDSYRRVTT